MGDLKFEEKCDLGRGNKTNKIRGFAVTKECISIVFVI